MHRRTSDSPRRTALRSLGLFGALVVGSSCHEPLDTTRRAPPRATLGDDLYGVVCDRVGASSFNEDMTGASYQGICHYDAEGAYSNKVDTAMLPPISGERATEARRLAMAKMETLARWRSDLIHAVNAAFPDIEIKDVSSADPNAKVRLHDALLSLLQSMSSLYEENPFDPTGAPLLPAQTRSVGRLLDAFVASEPTVEAFSKIWGRQGYRPSPVSLGAVRSALAYPGLRAMMKTSLEVLGPGGAAASQLQALFAAGKQELLTMEATESALGPYVVDPATAQPNRARSTVELAAALALAQDPRFAESDSIPQSYIARRDRRGFVLTASDAVAAPFIDADADGLADVDPFGRFVGASSSPLTIDPPFAIPGVASREPDGFGRTGAELYQYLDTSRTLAGAVARTLVPLVDGTKYASAGDPAPWDSEHEGLMDAIAGSYFLFGDREDATYDYDSKTVKPGTQSCASCLHYSRFRGEDSPITDLVHALGQILADKDSDAFLLGLIDLLENHEDVLARMAGAGLAARDISRKHDKLAEQGLEPLAELPYEAPIWDELAAVAAKIVGHTGLLSSLIRGLSDDAVLVPHDGARHLGDSLAKMMLNRDRLAYDPAHLNGSPLNLTVGGTSTDAPRTPVDLTKPKQGDNRSCLERSLQLIHDTSGVVQCNKEGARVNVLLIGIPITVPGTFAECDLFEIDNLAAFYLDAFLPASHPKRTQLYIKNSILRALTSDSVLVNSSGITGMGSHPSPAALGRLVFFGADSQRYPNLPDLDPYRTSLNERSNNFISGMLEPASTRHCPKNSSGANTCANPADLLRTRVPGTIFVLERYGFGDYLSPIVEAFAGVAPDYTGEELFIDLLSTAYQHWPGPVHGPECSKTGSRDTNLAYCSEAGVNTYEPILAEALQATDLIASTVAFAKVATQASTVTVQRGPRAGEVWTGAEVLERMARLLFSPEYAAGVGMVDRKGSKSTTWVDGTPQDQLTVFTLVADALHKIDLRFDESPAPDARDRKSQWKRARSEIVDALLGVEGTGAEAHFKNRALPRIAIAGLKVLREQLNARCPDRETTGRCAWASQELGTKVADVLSGPLFASLLDVQESLRAHEPARRELERFLTYLLDVAGDDASFQALLASMSDAVQILSNDDILTPILRAGSVGMSPESDAAGPGVADTGLKALKALTDDKYDKHHALEQILPALVTPIQENGVPETFWRAPIQIFMDAISDVSRIDASSTEPLKPEDYKRMFTTARDLMLDERRGLEQIYSIVKNRPHE